MDSGRFYTRNWEIKKSEDYLQKEHFDKLLETNSAILRNYY